MRRIDRKKRTIINYTGVAVLAGLVGMGIGYFQPHQSNEQTHFAPEVTEKVKAQQTKLSETQKQVAEAESKLKDAQTQLNTTNQVQTDAQANLKDLNEQATDLQKQVTASTSKNGEQGTTKTDQTPEGGSANMVNKTYDNWDQLLSDLSEQYPTLQTLDLDTYASVDSPAFINMNTNYEPDNKDASTKAFISANPVNLSGDQLNQFSCFMYDLYKAVHDGTYTGVVQ